MEIAGGPVKGVKSHRGRLLRHEAAKGPCMALAERWSCTRSRAAGGDALPGHFQRRSVEAGPVGEERANQAEEAAIHADNGRLEERALEDAVALLGVEDAVEGAQV